MLLALFSDRVTNEEFAHWFGPDTAGPPERYKEISLEVWQLWQGHITDSPKS
jgi:hypothetical protein